MTDHPDSVERRILSGGSLGGKSTGETWEQLVARLHAELAAERERAEELQGLLTVACADLDAERERYAKLEAELQRIIFLIVDDPPPPHEAMSRCPECGESIPCSGFHPAVTEPTPKPTDACDYLEVLRSNVNLLCETQHNVNLRGAEQYLIFSKCIGHIRDAIAAWEKERAKWMGAATQAKLRECDLHAALERIEEEMRECLITAGADAMLNHFADALRAAREGGKHGQT